MTVAEALREATARLSETCDTARLDAELLMAHAMGVSRSDMLLRHMRNETPEAFAALVDRRARYEPVAHILGRQEFFAIDFRVTPDTLVPRGDSETIVRAALELVGETGRVLDLGTGTGALLLAFLANRPDWSGLGLDASEGAVAVADGNAESLGLAARARILVGDWTNPGWADDLGMFDLVLCNPPYVETDAELARDVRDFEPDSALFAGEDGLDAYRALFPQLDQLLATGAKAIFEIGYRQRDAIADLAQDCGFAAEILSDLGGRPRGAILRRKNPWGVGKGDSSV